MERKNKAIIGLLLISLLSFGVVPSFSVQAQTCDPDSLVPVSYGQRGTAVKNAQACLIEAGYDIPAGATGYYGAQTRSAVKAFYADWYGTWTGNNLGPRGVTELKSRLASAPAPSQPTTGGVSSEVLAQVLAKLQAGDTAGALALLLSALGQQVPTTTTTQPTTSTTTTTTEGLTPGVPGLLSADQDPSVSGITVREGETAKVFGIRFRADSGAVAVKSFILRWDSNNPAAPHRVLSRLEVIDENNNVLFGTDVTSNTFLQDANLNYYLPVSGLNVVVPANQYKSVFVRVTLVGTLPGSVTNQNIAFSIKTSEIRGVDGTNSTLTASGNNLSPAFTAQATIAGSAQLVASRDQNSPRTGYVFADDQVNGKATDVKALVVNLLAKNDNLKLTKVTGKVNGATSKVERVKVKVGDSQFTATPDSSGNFDVTITSYPVVNKDQTMSLTISVDLKDASVTPATFTVALSTTTAQNSLGDTNNYSTQATSDVLSWVKAGPTFSVVDKQLILKAKKDSSQTIVTTTIDTVRYRVAVTANSADIYVPSTTVATTSVQNAANSELYATSSMSVVSVDPVNTELVSGYYRVPQGNTVTFEIVVTPNADLTGNLTLRAKLMTFNWNDDTSSSDIAADFLQYYQDFWTSFVSPQ